jgi:hypothetical protein
MCCYTATYICQVLLAVTLLQLGIEVQDTIGPVIAIPYLGIKSSHVITIFANQLKAHLGAVWCKWEKDNTTISTAARVTAARTTATGTGNESESMGAMALVDHQCRRPAKPATVRLQRTTRWWENA